MGFFHAKTKSWMAALLVLIGSIGSMPLVASGQQIFAGLETFETGLSDEIEYDKYLKEYGKYDAPEAEIILDNSLSPVTEKGLTPEVENDFKGEKGPSIRSEGDENLLWDFNVEESGIYHLQFYYYPLEGSGNTIVRGIRIDGEYPFREASYIELDRIWSNKPGERQYDYQGNQIMVEQVESPAWVESYAWGMYGKPGEPYIFYLSSGRHTLELVGEREPMMLKYIKFVPVSKAQGIPYSEVKNEYNKAGYKRVSQNAVIRLQGEDADAKSDQSMFPLADRTSPVVEPYDHAKILYNTIGGNQWTNTGQWVEWRFEVKEAGLYSIAIHFKQSLKTGRASVRELYIDGQLPFAEAKSIAFPYKSTWQLSYISGDSGEPFEIYLDKGWHTIRLRAGLGYYTDVLTEARGILLELNEIYREIVMVTGTSPDIYRDYHFDKMIPETLDKMRNISGRLKKLESEINAIDPKSGKDVADIKRLYVQLDSILKDTDSISRRLTSYKDNIAAFGTWINAQMGQPLEIDYLQLSSCELPLGPGDSGFGKTLVHYMRQFISSFYMDYSSIGRVNQKSDKTIQVWMTIGRDQAQILKYLINSKFTPANGIAVDLQLVSSKALLPAVLSGKAPDVTLNLAQAEPLNIAMRKGLYNLKQYSDLNEVAKEFYDNSFIPFEYNGGLWALPETLTFPVLFYRKDLVKELNIDLKDLNQWDTLLENVLPKLQKKSLTFGMLPSIQNYLIFCYQRDGSMYEQNNTVSGLGSAAAIDSMKQYTMLYTQYGLPISYDFANRFRTGEIPIAIADYTQYNLLTVFAPEIKGLWGIRPVPGTVVDGELRNTAAATVTGCAIMAQTEYPDESWKFLKWWVSAEVQSAFGKALESVVGAASRYNTANKNAIAQAGWDKEFLTVLEYQAQQLKAYDEVPGGYITPRLFDFTFRDILYKDADVRESMNKMVVDINRELKNKQRQYSTVR